MNGIMVLDGGFRVIVDCIETYYPVLLPAGVGEKAEFDYTRIETRSGRKIRFSGKPEDLDRLIMAAVRNMEHRLHSYPRDQDDGR